MGKHNYYYYYTGVPRSVSDNKSLRISALVGAVVGGALGIVTGLVSLVLGIIKLKRECGSG